MATSDQPATAAPTLGDLRKGQHQPPKPGVIKMGRCWPEDQEAEGE